MYKSFLKSVHKTSSYANIKHKFLKSESFQLKDFTSFEEHKARTCWYHQPFHLMYRYQIKGKDKKGMDRNKQK